jgi:selenocysteine-specific elongation factor
MRVIGTAGHVDHGKSTLVQALTGTHPDRLKEEREREMTIDLGFAWLTLPGGEEVGIVDVPGHRDFIENMLAGVGGIDAALFVVAADEGVMPQTREHLAILDILKINAGVVALTKIDLVDEPEWLDLVEADVRQVLQGTELAQAPIVRVSARTKQGVLELLSRLDSLLATRPVRPDLNRPRLPIDRVFTIAGFGTVVTGTLIDGQLHAGDEIEILPSRLNGRIRGLQSHKKKEESAIPGSRTAVNISGIPLELVKRGEVVTHPSTYQPTRRLDARFKLLADASAPLQHFTEVKLFAGTAEVLARVRLLGDEVLEPGQEGWIQIETVEPVIAVRGDHYILRRPSPGETLGGGTVVDPNPRKRHKRFHGETLENLEALSRGTPEEVIILAFNALGVAPMKDVIAKSNLDLGVAQQAILSLIQNGIVISIEDALQTKPSMQEMLTLKGFWDQLGVKILQEVEKYHAAYPLRAGMPREELRSRQKGMLSSTPKLFNAMLRRLVSSGQLVESGPLVYLPGHAIRFSPQQDRQVQKLLARFAQSPYAPPSVKECQAEVGDDLYQAMLDLDLLVSVSHEVVFRRQDYDKLEKETRQLLTQKGTITAAEARDHFNTSRKYILAFLEYLDAKGITVRDGDQRRLKN